MSSTVLKFLDSNYFLEEHRHSIDHIKDLYNKRLYYELSEFIIEFLTNLKQELDLTQFFESIVLEIAKRINPITFARTLILITSRIKSSDLSRAFSFLNLHINHVTIKDDVTASRLCSVYLAKLHLYNHQLITAHDILFKTRSEIECANSVTILHIYFYDAILYYHFLKNDYYNYHSDCLKYYGAYSKFNIFIDNDGVNKASYCAISTILSPFCTNVAEVLSNKTIIRELTNVNENTLIRLLTILHEGDMKTFNTHAHIIESHIFLNKHLLVIREKIILMNILNLALDCIIHRRKLTFSLISESAQIGNDAVEHFLIRAFALGMVRGSIDQVNQAVDLTWVKPKFITPPYVAILKEQLMLWNNQICELHDSLVSTYSSG